MNNRALGILAMICAPALLIEEILLRGQESAAITGIASMVFTAGWICSNTGMRRMKATGNGTWGRTVLLIQLVGFVLAFAFGFFEATGLLGRESIVFNLTDVAWPLSMLWMVVVGITVIRAKQLSGWQRYACYDGQCDWNLRGGERGFNLRPRARWLPGAGLLAAGRVD